MTNREIQTKRYPLRGALYGLLIGLSVAYFLYFQFAVFGFDSVVGVATRFGIVIVAGMVLGVVWAFVAPARKPKDAPPAAVAAEPAPEPVAEATDDAEGEDAADESADGEDETNADEGDADED